MSGAFFSVPLVKVNAIAKLVPEDPNMTLEKALEIDPELHNRSIETDEEARDVHRHCQKARRLGPQYRHPCGWDHHQRRSAHRPYPCLHSERF